MPSASLKKAVKDGWISQKQYDKMPEGLLTGIVARNKKAGKKVGAKSTFKGGKGTGTKKGGARKGQPKGARLAFDALSTRPKKGKGKKGGKK